MGWHHDILARFRLARRQPGESKQRWVAYCPVHEGDGGEHRPSLSLWLVASGQKLLIGCWAGCAKQDVLRAVGLKMSNLFAPNGKHEKPAERRIVAEYDYLDEMGTILYQAVRYDPKGFAQRRPDGNGYWKWNLDGVRLVPYRLPFLLARPAAPVWIVEGEKDAEALASLGLESTTGAGGVGMGWQPEYSRLLQGRHCVLVPDMDVPGLAHMERAAGSLLRHGAAGVRWVMLSSEVKDVSDYLAAGGTAAGLAALYREAREYR